MQATMLGNFRSTFRRRENKDDGRSSPLTSPARDLSITSPLDPSQSRSLGSLRTLLTPRPNSSTQGVNETDGYFSEHDGEALGLHVIHEPEAPPIVDIIFVHGLGGHSFNTWSKNRRKDLFWPGLWLPKDPKIRKARLFTYGYNSSLTGPKSMSNIRAFARSLLFDMHNSRGYQNSSTRIGDVPIIFVVHSMGGLVVKKACLLVQNDSSYKKIARSISGIVFLSTPHRGSSLAHVLDLILRSILQQKRPFVKDLERNSPAIEDINEEFRHLAPKLSIISFYEELHTAILTQSLMIVARDSTILGYENEQVRGLPADHHTICKYENEYDPNFTIVRDVLKGLVERFSDNGFEPVSHAHPGTHDNIKNSLGISHTTIEDLDLAQRLWIPGTCEWILENPIIQAWLQNPSHSHLVWYNAPPGSGKSVLSSSMVQHLQSNGYNCQYYFFSEGDQERRRVSELLKSMAYQLCKFMPDYAEELLAVNTKESQLDEGDYKLLWQTLYRNLLFARVTECPFFWVIDGLDESECPVTVLQLLEELLSKSRIIVKILITGRRTDSIALTFKTLQRSVRTDEINESDNNNNSHDIQLLVDRELEIMHGSMEHRTHLRQDILKRASGNFLWVRLALEELHKCQTESEREFILKQIPSDVTSMYVRMEQLVLDNPNRRHVGLAHDFLLWAIYAPRTLRLNELQEAIGQVYPDIIELEKTLRDVCGPFVLVDITKHGVMVHQTAREFITKVSKSTIAISPQSAHNILLIRSLAPFYDLGPYGAAHGQGKQTPTREELENYRPFLIYAANSWLYHLSCADPSNDEVMDALEWFFCGPTVINWIYVLAIADQVKLLPKAGKTLMDFILENRKQNSSRVPMLRRLPTVELLGSWSVDLTKMAAKFNESLFTQPSAIYYNIPVLCPTISTLPPLCLRCKRWITRPMSSFAVMQSRFPVEVRLHNITIGHMVAKYKGHKLFDWPALTDDYMESKLTADEATENPAGKRFRREVSHLSGAIASEHPSLTALEASTKSYWDLIVPKKAEAHHWYATGNENGELWYTDVHLGFRVELTRFCDFHRITHLTCTLCAEILVAADLAGDIKIIQVCKDEPRHVNVTDIKYSEDPSFNFENRAIHQILLLDCARRLLIIRRDSAQTWDIFDHGIQKSNDVMIRDITSRQWLNHPSLEELLIGIGSEDIQVFDWRSLKQVGRLFIDSDSATRTCAASSPVLKMDDATNSPSETLPSCRECAATTIVSAMFTQSGDHIWVELKEEMALSKVTHRHLLIEAEGLAEAEDGAVVDYLEIPYDVAQNIEVPLGILSEGRLVFFNRDRWICSMVLHEPLTVDRIKRHYLIPREWTNTEDLRQCRLLADGTLYYPQDGNVASIWYDFGLMHWMLNTGQR